MTKTNSRFEHGLHNESACKYLNVQAEFKDWVITTAFYSALQFVSSKIFPFEVNAIGGKKTTIENIDQYYNYEKAKQKNINKHELLLQLVDRNFPDGGIYECYDWLLSSATTARYHHYQHPPEIATRAVNYLERIKKKCA